MSGKSFLYIVIITFITVLIWVTLDITRGEPKTVSPEVQQLITPISPDFDQEVLNDLQ